MNATAKSHWKTLDRIVEINSHWVKLIAEHLENTEGQILEYWRVERADSVIALTVQDNKFLFPVPMYRPGIGETTLDFPGGRVPAGETAAAAVPGIIKKELGVTEDAIARIQPIDEIGWAINSSFSNQKLYGFVAQLQPTAAVNPELIGAKYPTTPEGISELLKKLTCLQCRSLLLELLARNYRF
ncbi:MAG: NUDIX hydrolase [Microcoleus sp. SU_5_6]|nr:NUDIX hydrolase [Microcoleus sp. SU_5_6]NJL68139.1 NUDIX hydrolase [Microcoleus sp. SM1_3_4]